MADKNIKINIDVNTGKVEDSIGQLKALKKQLKDTAAGSSEFSALQKQITDLEVNIKGAKAAGSDWVKSLEDAGGPLGALGKTIAGLKASTVSFGAALKATGIGLIVAVIGTLTAAFAENEKEMKKLDPLIVGFQKILNGVLGALQPMIDGFIELAVKALPYVSKAFGVAYSALSAFLTSLGKIGSAVGKLIKGDFKGAWEDAKTSVTGFVDNYDKSMERYVAGTKEVTKKEKENADKYREELLKKLEAQDKYNEAVLAKLKAEALATDFNEEQKLATEEVFAKKSYDLKVKELDEKLKLYKKGSADYKTIEGEKLALDANRITELKGFATEEEKLADERNKKIIDFEVKLAQDLQKIDDEKEAKRIQSMNDDLQLLQAQQKTLQDGTQAYLDNSIKIENEAYQIKLANAKKNATLIAAIEKEHEANIKDIKLKAFIAEKQLAIERMGVIGDIGTALQQLAGKNKALAIAGIVIEKAAAIGQIWAGNAVANAKAIAASPLTFGQPWVTINTVLAGVQTALAIATGAQAISAINSVDTGPASGGVSASGGGSITPPTAPTTPSVAAPQIQTAGGQDATSRLGQTISNAQTPIKAYVVSQDVSSMQALDRRTNRAATLSGGY